jgi:hypothetical protein
MGQSIDSLSQVSALDTGYLITVIESGVTAYNISFNNFRKNLNDIRSTGVDMTLGADSDAPSIVIDSATSFVGIGSFYTGITPQYTFEVAGASGSSPGISLRGTGVNQNLVFNDDVAAWQFTKNSDNDFYLSGLSSLHKSLHFPSGSGVFISDGAANNATGLDSGINVQLYANDKIRFSVDNSATSLDLTIDASGIQSNSDLYINYNYDANITSGSFFGLSGAVFVSNSTQNSRVGNISTTPDARLIVTNQPTNGATYKTLLLEDSNYANLYFRTSGISTNASITFDPGASNLYFGRNKTASTFNTGDPFVVGLASKRIGVGGVVPIYTLDITGSSNLAQRIQTSDDDLVIKYQSNYPGTTGPVNSIFTTYSSGITNNFIVGYDFQNEYFFFQTGDTQNVYYTARNTHKFHDSGDIDINRYYFTQNNFSQGKFIQAHYASCTGDVSPTYINLNNANYDFNISGNAAYYNLTPMSGRIIGVDLVCQTDGDFNGATGYLVFNKFTGITETTVGTTGFISGTNYYQIYDAANTDYFGSPTIGSRAYVSGLIGGDNIFSLAAKYSAVNPNGPFRGTVSQLRFNKFNYIDWVFYCLSGSSLHLIDKPFNLTTTVEYFVENDTDAENGTYIA